MSLSSCNKCNHLGGFKFEREYSPEEFLEGKRSSEIWIVGLNPATEVGSNGPGSKEELQSYFVPGEKFYSYFRDFRRVSDLVYDGFGLEGGTAHTDIVKCGSKSFPSGKAGAELVNNCSPYLKKQIISFKPRLLICNGRPVSNYMQQQFPASCDPSNTETSYWATVEGVDICIVLSGFIGRIDNWARKRLGVEIDARFAESKKRRA